MTKIIVYRGLWEYLRQQGLKTIEIIETANAWDYRINLNEFSVKETFHHSLKAIFEDAGNWFLDDKTPYVPSDDPRENLKRVVNRMINAFERYDNNDLSNEFTFQWGQRTTIAGAIQQNLFHAVGHFSQLRNWVGGHKRSQGKNRMGDSKGFKVDLV